MEKNQSGMTTVGAVFATLGALIVLGGIVVGGYLGGWWLKTDINNRQAHLNRTTFEQQTTYRDEMVRKIEDVQAIDAQLAATPSPELQAQHQAIVNIVCRDNTHINGGLDRTTAEFVRKECVQ